MKLQLRKAELRDMDQYYKWAIDPEVRKQSFNPHTATYEEHVAWFRSKMNEPASVLFIFENEEGEAVGQLRFQERNEEIVVGLNLDSAFRNRGLASSIIRMGTEEYLKSSPKYQPVAYIKVTNPASYKAFLNAGYKLKEERSMHNERVFKMVMELPGTK